MRIATITNWAYGATVVLTLISGTTMLLASSAEQKERAAVEQRARFDQMTSTLEEDTYRLTEQARLYTVNRNPSHVVVYRREAAGLKSVEDRVAHLRDAGARPAELETLKQGLTWADLLMDEQLAAIAAVERGDAEQAREIMFGAEYERDLDRVAGMIERFQYMLNQRTEDAVVKATEAARTLRGTSEAMLAITALLFLFVLYFVLKQRILRPVVKLSDVVTRLAAQDYAVAPPDISQVDEIGDMAHAIRIFRENGLERQRLEKETAKDRHMRDLLARMTQRLQGCDSNADLADVVRLFATEIAPAFAGRLYVYDETRGLMVEASNWQDPRHSPPEFPPSECWALRRGQLHRPAGARIDIPCPHLDGGAACDPVCVPLTAQGETIGLLFFEQADCDAEASSIPEVYLELMSETIGLALANLRLRDALRRQALVDPLTGLSNRHHLESVLDVQLGLAERAGKPVSCLMLAVDHFKHFNDQFGHDAGDTVLKAVGAILANSMRRDGLAFRYGGEEFLLLMPGVDADQAQARAEQIQQRIRALQVRHDGKALGPITLSFGLATCPDHVTGDALVQAADAALMRAKEQGRDRIVAAVVRAGHLAA